MKKILLGLFVLSSLSFANQTWPDTNTATLPVTITAEIINPNTQIAIIDSISNELLNYIFIEHGTLQSDTFETSETHQATGTFRVKRSKDNNSTFLLGDILTINITPDVDLKLAGSGETLLKSKLEVSSSQITNLTNKSITAIQTITSNLYKPADVKEILNGLYTSSGATLTVTLNKASI